MSPCWVPAGDPLMLAYHDDEWGRPVTDDRRLFERLCLEAFQAGLSWRSVLVRRAALREVFAGFDPEALAGWGEREVAAALGDARIIRNRRKVAAVVANARALLDLGRPIAELVWPYWSDGPAPRALTDIPATTPASVSLARDLRRSGFAFVGPTSAYATLQAAGVVDDHLADCPVRPAVEAQRAPVLEWARGLEPPT